MNHSLSWREHHNSLWLYKWWLAGARKVVWLEPADKKTHWWMLCFLGLIFHNIYIYNYNYNYTIFNIIYIYIIIIIYIYIAAVQQPFKPRGWRWKPWFQSNPASWSISDLSHSTHLHPPIIILGLCWLKDGTPQYAHVSWYLHDVPQNRVSFILFVCWLCHVSSGDKIFRLSPPKPGTWRMPMHCAPSTTLRAPWMPPRRQRRASRWRDRGFLQCGPPQLCLLV